jgi:hypothetical protein
MHDSALDAVAIVTADRPHLLDRCLTALCTQCHVYGHSPRVLVVDGSRRAAADTRSVTERARGRLRPQYVGRAEAAAVRTVLSRHGVRREVLHALLTPGSIGCGRNLALVLTVGQKVLMLDDDIVLDPCTLTTRLRASGLRFKGDCRYWTFFATRTQALAAAEPSPVDVLSSHGAYLGRAISDVAPEDSTRRDMDTHRRAHRSDVERGRRLRVSLTGLAGDSGRYCSHQALFRPRISEGPGGRTPHARTLPLTSREVCCIADAPTVSLNADCMMYCTGLANDGFLPPFVPRGRGEDGIFGAVLALCDPAAAFMHLPFGVRHDSERPSGFGSEAMASARQSRLAEVMAVLIRPGVPARGTVAADRLREIAERLMSAAAVAPMAFVNCLSEAILRIRARQIALAEEAMGSGAQARLWRSALSEYRTTLKSHSAQAGFCLPLEFRQSPTIEAGFRHLQSFVGQFGSACASWPDVLKAAENHSRALRPGTAAG